MNASFMSNVFVGLALIGDMLNNDTKRAGDAMVAIMTERNKTEIMAVSFHQAHHRQPNEGENFTEDPVALEAYKRLMIFTRNLVQNIFDEADRQDRAEAARKTEQELNALKMKLRVSNAPHPEGTVAQLAERFGVSKSEIRRRKIDGTLNELLAKKS